jgi:hypothetical protein
MLLKITYLSCTVFSDGWLADAVGGATVSGKKKIGNPLGYFKTILVSSANEQGKNLRQLMRDIEIPPKPKAESPAIDLAEMVKNPNEQGCENDACT